MKNYVWELQSNIADTWSFRVKVLAKFLASQESRFAFLPNESSQVTPAIAESVGSLTSYLKLDSYVRWLKKEIGCSATRTPHARIPAIFLLHVPPEMHCWSMSKLS